MSSLFLAIRTLAYMAGFVLVWGGLALQFRTMGGEAQLPSAFHWFGMGLMLLGGFLVLTCAGWFVFAGRGTPAPFDAPRSFVPSGPYRWVRNPMYVGALILLIGFGLWHRSLPMVLLALPAFLLAHLFVLLYEEPTLRKRFGLPYVMYLAVVNRWVPKNPKSHDGAV